MHLPLIQPLILSRLESLLLPLLLLLLQSLLLPLFQPLFLTLFEPLLPHLPITHSPQAEVKSSTQLGATGTPSIPAHKSSLENTGFLITFEALRAPG